MKKENLKNVVAFQQPDASAVGHAGAKPESPSDRVRRLYTAQGGPLMGWLLDEARRRNMDLQDMARELGVTYGYVSQLRTGVRKTSTTSKAFATACARFLGVETCLVLLLSGYLTMSDFATRAESDDEAVERALRLMQDDPHIRAVIPVDLSQLCADGKRALVMLYSEVAGRDVFQARQLPQVLRWLQRAALIHEENEFESLAGHRDTSERLA